MRDEHFDTLSRVLSSGATWRGILSAVAGVAGLQVTETAAARRERTKRRTGRRVGTEQAFTIAEGCPAPAPVSIELLSAFYPGYWWDHTHLTAAVQAHPKADPTLIAAAREAIAIWDRILRREFNNEVTLTDVTDTQRPAHKADIVLHFVPRAPCPCNNVLVKSDKPKPEELDPFLDRAS